MRINVIGITRKLLPFIMIGVIGLLVVNKTLNTHTHQMIDGTLVSHSHPYDKPNDTNPIKSHQHTKTAFYFFEIIDILVFTLYGLIILLFLSGKEKLALYPVIVFNSEPIFHDKGRAPPPC